MNKLLKSWAAFRPQKRGPMILKGDEKLREKAAPHDSWKSYVGDSNFGDRNKGRTKLHLSLIPQPFFGDLSRARIFILALNPGLNPIDYFAEFHCPEYRKVLLDTLKQRFKGYRFPFFWLDPRFSWHSGARYWHGRLAALVDQFAAEQELPRIEALEFCSRSIAVIELLPYHSPSFGLPDRIMGGLCSFQLAKAFVSKVLVPRAKRGDALIIATRKGDAWELPKRRHIIVYSGAEVRAAYVTPKSRGGQAMLKFLKKTWERKP